MLNNNTNENLLERCKKAPEDIKYMLLHEDFEAVVQVIGKDNGITPQQSFEVEEEIVDVLLGISRIKDFTQNIAKVLSLTEEGVYGIVKDIDENIFSEVRESLEKINAVEKESGVSEEKTLKEPVNNVVFKKAKKIEVNQIKNNEADKLQSTASHLTQPIPTSVSKLTQTQILKPAPPLAMQPTPKPSSLVPPHAPVKVSDKHQKTQSSIIKLKLQKEKVPQFQSIPTTLPVNLKHMPPPPIPPKNEQASETIVGNIGTGSTEPKAHMFEEKLHNSSVVAGVEKEKEGVSSLVPPMAKQDPYRESLK